MQTGQYADQDDVITIHGAFGLLWRRRAIILTSIVFCAGLAVLFALRQPALYSASSEVLLNNQNLPSIVTGVDTGYSDPERLAATQARIARAPEVAQTVIAEAGLQMTPKQFLDASGVDITADADLLRFSVQESTPERAQQLSALYAQKYVSYRNELDSRTIAEARKGILDELARLRGEGQTGTALFSSLTEKAQSLQTLQTLQASNAYIVSSASDAEKVQPRPIRAGILGLFGGIVLGLLVALLRDRLDTAVRSPSELAQRLELPILARIPKVGGAGRTAESILVHKDANSPVAESNRMLRANVRFAMEETGAKVLMVVSATAGEGKSTTVSNLAASLAMIGRRVSIVDLDLRRPTLHRIFGADRAPGIAEVVLERAPLEECLVRVHPLPGVGSQWGKDEGTLDLLPAGGQTGAAGELVTSPVIAEILSDLEQRSDYVLIDCAPALLVSETRVLTGRADAVLVVADVKRMPGETVEALKEFLRRSPAKPLGIVTIGQQGTHRAYAYAYGDD